MSEGDITARGGRAPAVIAIAVAALALLIAGAAPALALTGKDPTVWLCKPGQQPNPCASSRKTTIVTYAGETRTEKVEHATRTSPPPVDCFYVYPTVSEQAGPNADETIEPQETQIAVEQASRFSQNCRVYAPMYRQLTIKAIKTPGEVTPTAATIAYIGVRSAWLQYMARYNKGRGVVLIGHSQGSLMLTQLIRELIEPNPAVRSQLVSALIIGGNVLVPEGASSGVTFNNVGACQRATSTGCVIAYSTFAKEPPANAFFGRTTSPLLAGSPPPPGSEVLCVNPTLLEQTGAAGGLLPEASTTPFPGQFGALAPSPEGATPWLAMPGLATAQCKHENGATWLQISNAPGISEAVLNARAAKHETAVESLGPEWGLHLYDVNLALGNLVQTVAIQSQAYLFGH